MAILWTAVAEMRSGGSNDQGIFFDSTFGGNDYSLQDAAEETYTDLASDGAGTGISTSAKTFPADCAGNGLRIENTGTFTAGWYIIVAYNSPTSVTIDRSAGVSKTGGAGKLGGAAGLPTTALYNVFVDGNDLWIRGDGDYVGLATLITGNDGSTAKYIRVRGYKTVRGDCPTGTDRPLIARGAYPYGVDNYWLHDDIRFTYTGNTSCINSNDLGSLMRNCKIECLTSGALTYCTNVAGGHFHDCEVTAPNASSVTVGIYGTGWTGSPVAYCDIHDILGIGVQDQSGTGAAIIHNTISTCVGGVFANGAKASILNNTIRNCSGSGVEVSNAGITVENNDLNTCGVGLKGDASYQALNDKNNYYNNTLDISTNIVKGPGATANDPEYTDAANRDFNNALGVNDVAHPLAINLKQGAWQSSGGSMISKVSQS